VEEPVRGVPGPLAPGATRATGVTGATDAPPSVLVVQPRAELSAAVTEALRQEGFEVCTAADGLAAVYGLRHHWPDAVVLDLDVRGVSGFRLMRLLKEDRTAGPVPVLVMTALSFDEALDAIRLGADDLLELPCEPEEAVWRVRRLLAHRLMPAYEPFPWREDTSARRSIA
jgi:DNA-binding response OmpR family regulator